MMLMLLARQRSLLKRGIPRWQADSSTTTYILVPVAIEGKDAVAVAVAV
jgi:hypothetical protein